MKLRAGEPREAIVKTLLGVLGLALALVFVVAAGAVVVVLSATGLGILLARFLPLSVFEASLLTLISLLAFLYAAWRVVAAFVSTSTDSPFDADDDDEWGEEDEFDDDEGRSDDDAPLDKQAFIPSIPRWRQPIKRAEYDKAGRNDPCPCGSGKKYKNCHGKAN